MALLETVVLGIFIAECGIKICARAFKPLDYFRDAWNCFDFAIVAASVKKRGVVGDDTRKCRVFCIWKF